MGSALPGHPAASQPYQMAALVGIAALLRARLAAHALLPLPDWRFPWAPDDGQVHGDMRSASVAFHFEVAITGVERVPSSGDGCAGPP